MPRGDQKKRVVRWRRSYRESDARQWHVYCTLYGTTHRNRYSLMTLGMCREPCTHHVIISLISHLSLNSEGRWGTTDDFATNFLYFSLFSTALWDFANSRPVHSLMLSSHLFFRTPCFLPPFIVPCKMVLARPDEWETTISLQCASLCNGQEVFVCSDFLLDLGTDFLVGNMVFV